MLLDPAFQPKKNPLPFESGSGFWDKNWLCFRLLLVTTFHNHPNAARPAVMAAVVRVMAVMGSRYHLGLALYGSSRPKSMSADAPSQRN
jgi:hypothetical protein